MLRDVPNATGLGDARGGSSPHAVAPCSGGPTGAMVIAGIRSAYGQGNEQAAGGPCDLTLPMPVDVGMRPQPYPAAPNILAPRPIPESVWAALAESS
jgi:hypothetical protein